MQPPIETIRISQQGRDQLIKLRRQTGIEHWNVLCRWAFCVSIKEKSTPPTISQKLDGGVEMTWKVFSGEMNEVFSALAWLRVIKDGYDLSSEGAAMCLRAHIHRGISYLSAGKDSRSIANNFSKWF